MKEVFIYKITLFILLSILVQTSTAQVTIGSEHNPAAGSLLDLKERKVTDGSANSNKGLLLPRVILTTTQPKIGELSQSIGGTGAWDEAVHTGLVVYNAKNTLEACIGGANIGVYNWNGKQWLALYQKEIPMPATDHSSDIYGGANTYIVQKGYKTIQIPIKRGFDIWKAYTGATPADGKVLDPADANGLTGTLAANVVWEEASDGTIYDVISGNSVVRIVGTDENAILEVTSGFKTGNALVNVTIGGKVLWQWHIWVTEDDPTKTSHMFNTGKHVYWFMDRTLGAILTTGTYAYGIYYQWGRPTPIRKNDLGFTTVKATATEGENLTTAIQSADFITFGDKTSHDWYSSTAKQWDARWGDQSTNDAAIKSPFDPCPYGWRVASAVDGTSPWHCLDQSSGSGSGGWNFGETGRDIGHYALAGYRANGGGSLGEKGEKGYIWTASPKEALAGVLHFDINTITPEHKYNRANGMNVRCMKELQP